MRRKLKILVKVMLSMARTDQLILTDLLAIKKYLKELDDYHQKINDRLELIEERHQAFLNSKKEGKK